MSPSDRAEAREMLRAFFSPPVPPLEGLRFDGWEGHLARADWLWRQGRANDAWAVWSEVRRQEGSTDGRP